jgi:hypothetical protein
MIRAHINPNFLFSTLNLTSLKKKNGRMSPILNKPKKIITRPASFVRKEILVDSNFPNHVAEAPKRMKISENPTIKDTELRTTKSFCLVSSPLPEEPTFISRRETPDIKEMYPGINGRTQGDKNDITPAANAMVMGTLCVMVIYTILPECLW